MSASAVPFAAVALDLDGSLAGADHAVSPRALRALAALEGRGIRSIIVTGRTASAARIPWEQAGLSAPVISCNGAVIDDPASGTRLAEHHLPPAVVAAVLDVAERADLTVTLWTPEQMYASRRDETVELLETVQREPIEVSPPAEIAEKPLVKAMLAGPAERLDEATALVSRKVPLMMRSMDNFFETSPPGASKAGALRTVLDRIGVGPESCLGVGDGDTDLEWLSMVGRAVVPANARESVRAIAAEVVEHDADDGVAAFLETFFDLERSE